MALLNVSVRPQFQQAGPRKEPAMSEQYSADEDVSVFGLVKALAEAIASGVGTAEEDAARIGTAVGGGVSIFRAFFRS
jgi:hypothetical protein